MRKCEPDIAVYVGPTGVGLSVTYSAVHHPRLMLLPPVARGDLLVLPDCISTVLIVDGYFGSHPSVGHLELLRTLDRCRVFGCSSLGAIRAYELRNDGMIGLGRVYHTFFEFEDFMDDEMALLHAPAPYYWPITLPLVNVRFALRDLQEGGFCSADVAAQVILRLKSKYFGERTPETVLDAALDAGGAEFCEAFRLRLAQFDVKQSDYLEALHYILANVGCSGEVGTFI